MRRLLETGSSVRERRSFLLDAEALPDSNRFGPLSVSPRGWVCLPATSPTKERVAVFPAAARSARAVWWVDLSDRADLGRRYQG